MANWLAGREAVKRAAKIDGTDSDTMLDRLIADASKRFEDDCNRWFIPQTLTRYYDYKDPYTLWLDADLISVTTLQTKSQDTTPTTIAATDYYLEPVNDGPPYECIKIDLASSSTFEPGDDTAQHSIKVIGSWGYTSTTVVAGTVASGLAADAAATWFVCSDASLIDVGMTLLIDSEQLFVTDKRTADTTANTNGALTADKAITSVTVTDGTKVKADEVILINSERMYVESVAGNVLTVIRAYDGSVLAAHGDAQDVYVYRTLTVQRGVNGTTAAVHANATAVYKYTPPSDVVEQIIDDVIAAWAQQQSAWGRVVGAGETGVVQYSGRHLSARRQQLINEYGRFRVVF